MRGSVVAEGPEGIAVLEEVRGLLGLLLWTTLRSTAAWADSAGDDRSDLFPEGAGPKRFADILEVGPPPLLETSLRELAMILDRPAQVDPGAAGTAAIRIAGWAEEEGCRATAAEFYQLAANVCPANPRYALAAARSARDLADYGRAETWLHRSIGLSRQEEEWEIYVRSFLTYGIMMRRRGNLPAARRHFQRAMRRAVRVGDRGLKAESAHDLVVLEAEAGNLCEAERFGREAVANYDPGDSGVRRLAHDLGYLWLKQNRADNALRVFEAVFPVASASERPYVLGGLALAAGTVGFGSKYCFAREQLAQLNPAPGVAEAWVELAEGAVYLGRFGDARLAVAEAHRIASDRKEHRIEFLAERIEALIDSAQSALDAGEANGAERTNIQADPLVDQVVAALHPA